VLKTALQMYVNGKIMNGALNLNNVRCEASSHLRNKKKEYLKAKIEELETMGGGGALYRGINDFKKGYQLRTNIVKDEKGDLVTDSHIFWLGGGTISLSY